MTARVLPVDPTSYRVHLMHAVDRFWPQTNCYADLWIEILASIGAPPEAAFGFTLSQDFEGDQFTFFKPPLDDLERLFGLKVFELALYDDLVGHVEQQIARGRLVLVELDSFYMPDTRGLSYRETHGKTTIGLNRLDRAAKEVDYFHNDGFHRANGEDFDGLLRLLPGQTRDDTLFPYAEMVKFPAAGKPEGDVKREAQDILRRHHARRPAANPVAAFAGHAAAQADALMAREPSAFHLYAFNTLRQLGANFELLASHLNWLSPHYGEAATPALALAEGAKVAQFQLARAMRQKKHEKYIASLESLVPLHDAVMAALNRALAG
jgi:hypothetical protein